MENKIYFDRVRLERLNKFTMVIFDQSYISKEMCLPMIIYQSKKNEMKISHVKGKNEDLNTFR